MKIRKTKLIAILILVAIVFLFAIILTGCSGTGYVSAAPVNDTANQRQAEKTLKTNQQTPTDIDFSLERYNLIRRAYWVNGQREKAAAVPCAVEKPLGYIVLFTESGAIVNSFVVDGKVSSLNSYLSPDSEYYEINQGESGAWDDYNEWLADVDGSYGENDNGIFFFTPDGKYIEWTGTYLYSDIPFITEDPIVKVGANNE